MAELSHELFTQEEEAGEKKVIMIVEDNAGWHQSKNRELPLGIKIENLPAYSLLSTARGEIMANNR